MCDESGQNSVFSRQSVSAQVPQKLSNSETDSYISRISQLTTVAVALEASIDKERSAVAYEARSKSR